MLPVGPGDALNPTGLGDWAVWHSDVAIWGGGIAQGIDSAGMILYLTYKHVQGDLESAPTARRRRHRPDRRCAHR